MRFLQATVLTGDPAGEMVSKPINIAVDKIEAVYADKVAKMVKNKPTTVTTTILDTTTRSYRLKESLEKVLHELAAFE